MDKKDFQILLGNRIKQLRKEQNLTQMELAYRCNFEKSNMNRIESGNTNPTAYTLHIIAKNLNVSISDIFKYEEKINI